MQTAGSAADSSSTTIFATLPVTASNHPGNLGLHAGIELAHGTREKFTDWTQRVIAWVRDAEAKMADSLPASEIHRFETILPTLNSNRDYEKNIAAFEARLAKPRLIISRLFE